MTHAPGTNAPAGSSLGLWFDEFTIGQTWITPRRTITDGDIVAHRAISGDPGLAGTDGRLAPVGLLSIATGLSWVRLGINEGTALAFLGWQDWSFDRDARSGDTVHVVQRVDALRPSSSRPDRGVVTFGIQVLDSHDHLLQHGQWSLMWGRQLPSADL